MARNKKRKNSIFVVLVLILLVLVLGAGIFLTSDMRKNGDDSGQEQSDAPVVDPVTARATEILADMTLHEKICQLFIVTPEELTGVGQVIAAGESTRACIEEYPVGGLIYFAQNLKSVEQTKEMIANTQAYSVGATGIPMFISVDEEGGVVARCADKLGTTEFEPMYTYKDQGAEVAKANAKTIASDIKALGFNLDFAPVADVWSNPANRVIGTRAYSDDAAQTADLVAAAVAGFDEAGVASTLKHFPGHGDTAEDSHKTAAYSYRTLDQLRQGEFLPFKAGIDAGADMVMMGHITVPEVDTVPATFSQKIIGELLRGELGFDGVVITDSMVMSAVTHLYSSPEASLAAFIAGNDILLCGDDLKGSVARLTEACQSGELSEERVNESVMRILELKIRRGILE